VFNEDRESIEELKKNTTSRMILMLVVMAAEQHLASLKARRSDTRDYIQTSDAQTAAFFKAAVCVEHECWGSTDFVESYREIIMSVSQDNSLQEAIKILEGWVQNAKEYGF
jgi:hypothetical protein